MNCFWSPKGGVGTTVVVAALAADLAKRGEVLVVDLAGDLPALAGLPDPRYGVTDWLAAEHREPEGLRRLEMPTSTGVAIVAAGNAVSWTHDAVLELFALLGADDRPVIVDAGTIDVARSATDPTTELRRDATRAADRSIVCIRPCYLGLRRVGRSDLPIAGAVVIGEAGRALDAHDVEAVLGVEAVARVELDPAVARANCGRGGAIAPIFDAIVNATSHEKPGHSLDRRHRICTD